MNDAEKLKKLKIQLNIEPTDTSLDTKLNDYLKSAEAEIINWLYVHRNRIPDDVCIPQKYELVQLQAVIVGYNMEGGENETSHNENGISRQFHRDGMISYIHANVFPYVGVGR